MEGGVERVERERTPVKSPNVSIMELKHVFLTVVPFNSEGCLQKCFFHLKPCRKEVSENMDRI